MCVLQFDSSFANIIDTDANTPGPNAHDLMARRWPESVNACNFGLCLKEPSRPTSAVLCPSNTVLDVNYTRSCERYGSSIPRYMVHSILRSKRATYHAWKNWPRRYSHSGFRFVPLIKKDHFACALDILLLRRPEPYRAFDPVGDLDGRS